MCSVLSLVNYFTAVGPNLVSTSYDDRLTYLGLQRLELRRIYTDLIYMTVVMVEEKLILHIGYTYTCTI